MSINKSLYPWITNSLFERILHKNDDDENIIVEDFSIDPCVGKGENYASAMLRIHVNYLTGNKESRSKYLVIKAAITDDDTQNMLDEFDVYGREFKVFNEILPKVNKLMNNAGDSTKLGPICYDANSSLKYLIFEDLKVNGYKNCDKVIGLNFEHLKLTLQKLAKWHAATAVLYEQDPTIMNAHHISNISDKTDCFDPLFLNTLKSSIDEVQTWNGFEKYTEKMIELQKTIIKKGAKAFICNENSFNVLNHGDMWTNNIMHNYDNDGQLNDTLLVDFQVGFWGSPGIDLSYLLFSSSANDVYELEWDELLQIYHVELAKSLKLFNYSKVIPSLTDIQIELLNKGMNGVAFTIILLAVRFNADTQNADLSNLMLDTQEAIEYRRKIYSVPKLKERMEYLLKYFYRKGFLDA